MDNKLRKINKLLKKIITISLFLLAISLSYAYFTAQITGSESTTTITVGGGTMAIAFNGGSNITMSNMYPRAALWGTKTFTVTGNNTTDLTMYYNLTLEVTTNTFTSGALKYSLTSINTGSNGTVVPSAILKNIKNGTSSILLGNGTFTGPTSGNKVHSYTLDFYFPDTGVNQNENHKKSFTAYITIEEGIGTTELQDDLLAIYGGASSISYLPIFMFGTSTASGENNIYKINDDYGTSYFYRGEKNYVNNNIIFAEYQWKILRINGDGSLRIIFNGTCPNNSCSINTTGSSSTIGYSRFNPNNIDDVKLEGYMYSPSGLTASTTRTQATTNENNSTIKAFIDNWYSTNLYNTEYEDYISDTLFCNDRQVSSGWGYGASYTIYVPYNKSYGNDYLKCGLQNDRFTVDDENIGNGDLTYPVGLITVEEANIASISNVYDSYLDSGVHYWTLSPSRSTNVTYTPQVFVVASNGLIGEYIVGTNLYYVRPVINLNYDIQITGTGTTTDPYVVH